MFWLPRWLPNPVSIQSRYGVPPGPLIAIWGMETAFGTYTGRQNTISAVATLAYDCRRPDYFREQLIAVERGTMPRRILYVSGRPNWD